MKHDDYFHTYIMSLIRLLLNHSVFIKSEHFLEVLFAFLSIKRIAKRQGKRLLTCKF